MSRYGLTLVTAPAIEPVTLEEAKAHMRIDHTTDDPMIHALIRTARERVETWIGQALITQTWDLSLSGFPYGEELSLPLPPLQSVTSVTYYDTAAAATVWAASNYLVDTASQPGRLALAYGISWPSITLRPINGVVVRFVAGYGDDAGSVPESIRQAMLLLMGAMYEHREAVTVAAGGLMVVPMGVEALLGTYWRKGF